LLGGAAETGLDRGVAAGFVGDEPAAEARGGGRDALGLVAGVFFIFTTWVGDAVSGRTRSVIAIPSSPVPASPTTSIPGSASSSARRPARSIAWSSTSRIRISSRFTSHGGREGLPKRGAANFKPNAVRGKANCPVRNLPVRIHAGWGPGHTADNGVGA
jgi:hypothetical protein